MCETLFFHKKTFNQKFAKGKITYTIAEAIDNRFVHAHFIRKFKIAHDVSHNSIPSHHLQLIGYINGHVKSLKYQLGTKCIQIKQALQLSCNLDIQIAAIIDFNTQSLKIASNYY